MSSAGSVRVGSTVGASAVAIDDASHRGPWRLLLSQFLSNRSATVGA
ncbi:MAG: hypothetical protein QOF73_3898, partial [Thermomicrobiales bacterium]|nr:hypothetical protein [Thermomicrobiales bacterium]